jgi:hypothetical protein
MGHHLSEFIEMRRILEEESCLQASQILVREAMCYIQEATHRFPGDLALNLEKVADTRRGGSPYDESGDSSDVRQLKRLL